MTVAISFFQQSPESTSSPSTLRSSSVQSEWGKALLRCPPFQSAQSESNLPLNADRRQDEETEAILHRGSPDVRILDPRRRDHGGGAGRPRRDREAARGGCDVLIINYVTGFRLSWGPLGWLVPSESVAAAEEHGGGIRTVATMIGLVMDFEDVYRAWVFVARILDADCGEGELEMHCSKLGEEEAVSFEVEKVEKV
ncbi:hypothetical protein LINPERHAP2_LOCUS28885 [Linum perenne]